MSDRQRLFVLGAGIQGVCAALALSRAGHAVTLVDRAPDCMLRTSLINEGKIHLGHVYANDDSLRTSRLMLEAALQFGPLIEQYIGRPAPWPALRSNPFLYVVARDSMIDSGRLFDFYESLNDDYRSNNHDPAGHYLGRRPESLWKPASLPAMMNPQFAAAAAETPEMSVDTSRFREMLRAAIEASPVETLYGHTVTTVRRTADGFDVEGTASGGAAWKRRCGILINCLWGGRLEIDRQLGVAATRPHVHRLKFRILAELPPELSALPSMTIVLGPFGDIVTYPEDNTAYLSWYPACMRAWSEGVRTPRQWEEAVAGNVDPDTAREITDVSLRAFDAIIPGMGRCRNARVAAGVICCWGQSDIDDPGSELHQRHAIGVHQHGSYFSIDTGKFTCAPLFARHLVDRLQASH